ncbi:MAG: hypothetical protein OEL87_01505 [Nanoarchaeota archaeon]|nr:hypothetical protein [Nanoarchaeota archaeon]
MEGREFYLDWQKDILQIWELRKSRLVVEAMLKGIDLGHKFPAVHVVEISDNFYRLSGGEVNLGYYDGGNHRSVSHFIKKAPLLCVHSSWMGINPYDFREIKDFELRDFADEFKLKDSLTHLPRDIAEKFCLENRLSVRDFLSQ